jgi:hypothetical protein
MWLTIVGSMAVSSQGADKAKPTLVVVIPGWSSGDGRRIEPQGLFEVADKLQSDASKYGSDSHALLYKWPSHASNDGAVKDLAKKIREQADAMGGDVNLVVVGHSRGGIVAHEVLSEIAQDSKFDHVTGVLLDATAAKPMGDQFPTKKPEGVDHLYNFIDGHSFDETDLNTNHEWMGWENTDSDHNIEGAENVTILNSGHVGIVDDFLDTEYGGVRDDYKKENGLSDVPENERGQRTRETEQPPVQDDERVLSQIDKALDDSFREVGRWSQGEISLDPRNRLKDMEGLPEHWGGMGERGAEHLGGLGERAGGSAKRVYDDFRSDPQGAAKRAARWTQNEAEHLGGHYQRMGQKYGEHWGGMLEKGVDHAITSGGKTLNDKVVKPTGEELRRAREKAGQSLSDTEQKVGGSLSEARDRALDAASSTEEKIRKGMPRLPSTKDLADEAKNVRDQVTKGMPRLPSTKDAADQAKDLRDQVTKGMPRLPSTKDAADQAKDLRDQVTKGMPRLPSTKDAADQAKNLRDQVTKGMPRLPSTKDAADQAKDLRDQVTKGMPRLPSTKDAADQAKDLRDQVTKGMPRLPSTKDAADQVKDLRDQVTKGMPRLPSTKDAADQVKDLGEQVAKGLPTLPSTKDAVDRVNSGRERIGNVWNSERTRVEQGWNNGQERLGNTWNNGREQMGTGWNSSRENGQKFWNDLSQGLTNAAQSYVQQQQQQQQQQLERANQLRQQLARQQQEQLERANLVRQRLAQQAQREAEQRRQQLLSQMNQAGGAASDAWKNAGGAISNAGKNAGGTISNAGKNAGGAISNAGKNAGGAISNGWKGVSGGFSTGGSSW